MWYRGRGHAETGLTSARQLAAPRRQRHAQTWKGAARVLLPTDIGRLPLQRRSCQWMFLWGMVAIEAVSLIPCIMIITVDALNGAGGVGQFACTLMQ